MNFKKILSLSALILSFNFSPIAYANSTGSLSVNGQSLELHDYNYVGFQSVTENFATYQAIIDAGNLAMQAYPLSVNDNRNTHFYGHNPGIMSTMAANLQEGSIVTVTDFQGQVKSYEMHVVAKYPSNVTIDPNSWLYNAIWGNNGETITIQYCLPAENNIPIVWIGYPVEVNNEDKLEKEREEAKQKEEQKAKDEAERLKKEEQRIEQEKRRVGHCYQENN